MHVPYVVQAVKRVSTGPTAAGAVEGRTPYQVFKKGIRKPRSRKKSTGKEAKTAA